jgi:hypothetical protein
MTPEVPPLDDDTADLAAGLPPYVPPECDRARWALELAVRLVRERADWPYVLREQVLDGLRRALRQVQQREALLETLVELRLELMSLKGEQTP